MNIFKCLLVAVAIIGTHDLVSAEEVIGGSVVSISAESITIKSGENQKTLSLIPNIQVVGNAKSLAEVVAGNEVFVRCNAEGTAAILIRVNPPSPPPDEVVVGTVVSISESSLSLNIGQGVETFAVTPDTRKVNFNVISDIKAGDRIGIRISPDRKNTTTINTKP
jgi:hypothetical protein